MAKSPTLATAKPTAEFIGTFVFVFIGAGTAAVIGDGVGLPGIVATALAHGLAIMAFAFAYGPVSGGHMNPAVTVGVLAAGATELIEAVGYNKANSQEASLARSCCEPCSAASSPTSAHRHSHTTSLLAARRLQSRRLPASSSRQCSRSSS